MTKGIAVVVTAATALVIAALLFNANQRNLVPVMQTRTLITGDQAWSTSQHQNLRVAVLSDLHLDDTEEDYAALESLIGNVMAEKPDLVMLLGDYTQHPKDITNIGAHRTRLIATLEALTAIPTFAVLGNYETWSEPDRWRAEFTRSKITLLHNDVIETGAGGRTLCIRGLGDLFTQQFQFTPFPDHCKSLAKLSITHDPAGAFQPMMSGIVLAGHTHCGQVSLRWLGPLWVPSEAPKAATCGLYEDDERLLWVSSGVGTSILPIRLGAPAQWDLLTLRQLPAGNNGARLN